MFREYAYNYIQLYASFRFEINGRYYITYLLITSAKFIGVIIMDAYTTKTVGQHGECVEITHVRAVGNKLRIKLDLSTNIKKYFLKDNFVVHYDKNIDDVNESILTIPPLFIIAPVAWAAGADIYVEKLDQTALNSLHNVRQVFQGWYPKFSPFGRIYVNNLISNRFNNKQTALLFSGGLDSTTSYIMHKDEHPTLITLIRGENSSYEDEYYNKVKNAFVNFAKNEAVDIHFIKTDVWDTYSNLLNNKLLTREFGVIDWWTKVSHGLMLLGLSAPLTVEKIGTLYIAASFERNYKVRNGNGSHFLVNTNVSWADIQVVYDAQELAKHEKVRNVLRKNQGYCKNLRICSPIMNSGYYKNTRSQSHFKNCGSCQKCVERMIRLILDDIDPAENNFDLNDKVLDYAKRLLAAGVINLAENDLELWQDIQRHIPVSITDEGVKQRYQAKEFFEWFRDLDLYNYRWHSNERLRMLCWVYCMIKYRGIYGTLRLVIGNVRRNPTASK